MILLRFDGAADNNSTLKLMGIGVAIWIDGEYQPDLDLYDFAGTNGTSNIAEYSAFLLALRTVIKMQETYIGHNIVIQGDSQLIVKQFSGEFRCKVPHLKPLLLKCKTLANIISNLTVEWIPRDLNTEADRLSKLGITEFIKKNYVE